MRTRTWLADSIQALLGLFIFRHTAEGRKRGGVANVTTGRAVSEGAYAHVGQQLFTLIDARTWWAIGNCREGQLKRITPGMHADVYVLSRPDLHFRA
jgi:multidrug resistance efflux pump